MQNFKLSFLWFWKFSLFESRSKVNWLYFNKWRTVSNRIRVSPVLKEAHFYIYLFLIAITFYCRRCVKRYDVNSFWPCREQIRPFYLRCHDDEFECKISGKCLPRDWVRDGTVDCTSIKVSELHTVTQNITKMTVVLENNFVMLYIFKLCMRY